MKGKITQNRKKRGNKRKPPRTKKTDIKKAKAEQKKGSESKKAGEKQKKASASKQKKKANKKQAAKTTEKKLSNKETMELLSASLVSNSSGYFEAKGADSVSVFAEKRAFAFAPDNSFSRISLVP